MVFGHGDSSVCFVDEARGIRRTLIDQTGRFCQFPGIVRERFWTKDVPARSMLPRVRYRTSFEKRTDKWLMLWEIQPDGEYWRDEDGFGAEDDPEVTLYTYVDLDGNFTGPFRIYQIGHRCCCLDRFEYAHEQRWETVLQALKDGETVEDDLGLLFPWMQYMDLRVGIRRITNYYALWGKEDAAAYWAHPVLSRHLAEAVQVLLEKDGDIWDIVGYPQNEAVHSSMTLFFLATEEPVFKHVLDKYFNGKLEEKTVRYASI